MPTQKQMDSLNLYASIMDEVKMRIAAIDAGTGGSMQTLPPVIIREHCYLQIRLVCELVAIGCLVAHGDLTKASNLRRVWQPDKIMAGLEELHPDFFPHAVQHRPRPGNPFFEFRPRPGVLTKSELLALHGECNRVLHVGSLKNLLTKRFPKQIHYPDITAKAQKLLDLLAAHTHFLLPDLETPDHRTIFLCTLNGPDTNVRVVIGESGQPPRELLEIAAKDTG